MSDNAPVTVPASASAQERAIAYVSAIAKGDALDASLRVTIHFHPDHLVAGRTVLASLARDGLYRSQFETGTSNGALTAHPGGDRWRWESRLFGGAYDGAHPSERPKYGALNFRRRVDGAAPRFGSAHLRLNPAILNRSTFCYPDSVFEPSNFGVAARGSDLLALAASTTVDALDDYIEAQIHGSIELARDVEAIVLDACYRDTPIDHEARALGCPVEWHDGYRLSTDELRRHPTYRGPEYVALGLALAREGYLDPRILGEAACTGRYDPQALKRVWHYLARFGARVAR